MNLTDLTELVLYNRGVHRAVMANRERPARDWRRDNFARTGHALIRKEVGQ
jgi:hypothetical protein